MSGAFITFIMITAVASLANGYVENMITKKNKHEVQ